MCNNPRPPKYKVWALKVNIKALITFYPEVAQFPSVGAQSTQGPRARITKGPG